ncbi:MAG: flippase [Chloroflexi bacterium]|nr:flippase [Chloroflexota bacterium]
MATLLKVTFGALALLLGYGFVGLAGVSILTNGATMALLGALAWRLFFRPRFEFDRQLQREMVRESFPLMLNHLLATLFFKVDVPLLEIMRGEKQVGWYSTAYKFIDAFNIIPSFFTLALFPVMSRQAREDRPALRRSYALAVKLLVAVALPLAVVTSFGARLLIGLLAGAEFLPHGAIALALIVWSIPIGWINSVTNYLLVAVDQQRDLTRAFFIALLFNVVANLIFLPLYGYPAAAIITIFSELFEGMAFYRYLRRGLGPVPWPRLLWRLVLAGGAMAAIVALLWRLQPALALAAGLAAYAGGVVWLRAFEPDEVAVLRGILPARQRAATSPRL